MNLEAGSIQFSAFGGVATDGRGMGGTGRQVYGLQSIQIKAGVWLQLKTRENVRDITMKSQP
jgi:hypothetical protein